MPLNFGFSRLQEASGSSFLLSGGVREDELVTGRL